MIEVEIVITMEEDEYREAIAKGFERYTGGTEKLSEDEPLDDVGDFARGIPFLALDDSNTTILIV